MTEIRSTGMPLGTGFSSDAGGAGAAAAAAKADPAAALAALLASFVQTGATTSTSGASETGAARGDGEVSNANGAPSLPAPSQEMSAEDMAMMLQNLQSKTQDAQLKTSSQNLQTARTKMEQNHEKQMAKIKEWADKTAEANSKSKASGILGWIGKVAAFVASVVAVAVAAVATVATAGAAAPLLAIAVIGMVGAGMSLANEISKSQGGPEISIGKYLNQACTKMFVSMGMDEKKAEQAGKMLGGAIGVASGAVLIEPGMLGSMMEGIALLSGADEKQAAIVNMTFTIVATLAIAIGMTVASGGAASAGALKNVTSGMETAARIGKITQAVGQVTQGATQVSQGGIAIAVAADNKAAENTLADRKVLQALMTKLAAQMEEDKENVKKLLDEMQAGMEVVMKMLAGAADSRSQLAGNMGGGKSRMA